MKITNSIHDIVLLVRLNFESGSSSVLVVGDEEGLSGGAGRLAVALVLAQPRQAVDLGPQQVRLLAVLHLRGNYNILVLPNKLHKT